jgi:hypothetical protein
LVVIVGFSCFEPDSGTMRAYQTLQQVAGRPRTPPGTRTWQPIPHTVLLDQVCKWLGRCGYEVTAESHTLTGGGQRYFGVLDVTTDRDRSDYRATVGVRNANDKRFAAGVVLGNRVLVYSNLMFEGEISLSRKHTRFIRRDLSRLVRDAMRGLAKLRFLCLLFRTSSLPRQGL